MKTANYINSLNQTQKIIIGLVASFSIILLFAHNPFSGYTIEKVWQGSSRMFPNIPSLAKPENWDKSLPFSSWETNSPLIDWLGNVRNFIYSQIALYLIGAIFVGFVFSNSKKESDS